MYGVCFNIIIVLSEQESTGFQLFASRSNVWSMARASALGFVASTGLVVERGAILAWRGNVS